MVGWDISKVQRTLEKTEPEIWIFCCPPPPAPPTKRMTSCCLVPAISLYLTSIRFITLCFLCPRLFGSTFSLFKFLKQLPKTCKNRAMHHASKCELPVFRSLPRFHRVLSTPLEFLTGASKSSRVAVFPGHLAANQRVRAKCAPRRGEARGGPAVEFSSSHSQVSQHPALTSPDPGVCRGLEAGTLRAQQRLLFQCLSFSEI